MLIIRAPFNKCTGPIKFQWLRGGLSACMLFYEVLAFLLAAFRAWRTVRDDMKLWNNKRLSLSYVIFSQGLIYISAVLALSVMTLFLNFRVKFFLSRMFSSLKLPLSGFLTARFLIQLRKWERRKTHVDSLNTLPTVDIVATSTRIDFNHPGGSDPSHLRLGPSVIKELGRDIGPRPTSLDMTDPLVDDDTDSFEIRQSGDTDRVPRSSSSLSLPQQESVEAAASVEQRRVVPISTQPSMGAYGFDVTQSSISSI
ncbi:hypothetical protein D9611_012249 [Ephemerocybe angulata]|uniref:Uncharacterized protein n=1 Tax=Ephemerocybe angulata TaxID=980116 RepID=A0A8H5ES54_9AGAR|nr:hypothetical protein D9611_012249 [Tulosesus angulatus]